MSWTLFCFSFNLRLDLGNSEFYPSFFLGVREQLAATQVEVVVLWQASEDLARQLAEAAWVHSFTALAQSSGERYLALHDAAVVAVMMVLPAGTSVPDRLCCLPT